jgi:hypothetical protein
MAERGAASISAAVWAIIRFYILPVAEPDGRLKLINILMAKLELISKNKNVYCLLPAPPKAARTLAQKLESGVIAAALTFESACSRLLISIHACAADMPGANGSEICAAVHALATNVLDLTIGKTHPSFVDQIHKSTSTECAKQVANALVSEIFPRVEFHELSSQALYLSGLGTGLMKRIFEVIKVAALVDAKFVMQLVRRVGSVARALKSCLPRSQAPILQEARDILSSSLSHLQCLEKSSGWLHVVTSSHFEVVTHSLEDALDNDQCRAAAFELQKALVTPIGSVGCTLERELSCYA